MENAIVIELVKAGQLEDLTARGATMGLTGEEYAAAVIGKWLESGEALVLQEA